MIESDFVNNVAFIMDKHFPSSEETGVLKFMADLKGSDCLSVEECTSVFKGYHQWERRLVEKAAMIESDFVNNVAFIMDKHFPSSEETGVLKFMADLKGSDCLSVEECTSVFKGYHQWERRLVERIRLFISGRICFSFRRLLPVEKETSG
jgi:pyruvate formate-lyase activating enzyme-like uncharacterized protein